MPRYLLSVFAPAESVSFGNYGSKEAMLEAFAATSVFNDKLEREGRLVFADGLAPVPTAMTVDARGDAPVWTEGPRLRGAEHLGGFWVIEAADHDEARALAEEASAACRGAVEVRPFNTAESLEALRNA